MSDCSTHAYDVPLKPCPFCGGEARMGVNKLSTVREYFVGCMNCHIRLYKIGYKRFWSEAEAIAAWNSRTHGTLTAEQVREAVESNSWAETSSIREFNDSSWQGIADELNSRAERTCRINELDALTQTLSMANSCSWGECSECGCLTPTDSVFCVECGARVGE